MKGSLAERAWTRATRAPALSRRNFVIGVGATLLTACDLLPQARRPSHLPRVGHLSVNPLQTNESGWQGFLEGLRDAGWVDGRNVAVEWRDADGVAERLPALATELARLPVDVIVTGTVAGVQAATQASNTIPVVMMAVSDPVGSGLVPSLARPGNRVTGTASLAPQLTGKRIEFLSVALPGVSRAAILWNPTNPAEATAFAEAQMAASVVGIQLQSVEMRVAEDMSRAFDAISRGRGEAVIDGGGPLLANNRKRVLDFAAAQKLPVVGRGRPWVEDGALLSYGGNATDQWRRAASYVDRILRGTRPANLPVDLPTTFELVINRRTAQTLGITFGQSFLDQVTEELR